MEKLKDKGRALVFADTKKDIRYFLVKANDCITYVEHGVADIGVVGKDTLMEGGKDYYEMLDLEIGKCRFIVGGLKRCDPLQKNGHIRIGTKYPEVAGPGTSAPEEWTWRSSRSTARWNCLRCWDYAMASWILWKPERH